VLSLVAKLRDVDVHRKSSFGFIVSRRIGKATVRNLVKRRLRAVAQASENALVGWDIVVTARPPAATATFADLSDAMRAAIRRATNQPNSAASVDGQ
jgi:ribonuclease P protein component